MNQIQIAIIAFVVLIIVFTLFYYWYEDIKFKRKVENNFNQSTKDVLKEDKALVLDGITQGEYSAVKEILQKDTYGKNINMHDPLMGENSVVVIKKTDESLGEDILVGSIPEDSAEAFFIGLDEIEFDYKYFDIQQDMDLIIDIVFEEPTKVKMLPEVAQFTNKDFAFYILDKNSTWQQYEKGKKYVAKAIKFAVQLVDRDGLINQAQVSNIYNELHKFVISNIAHIRCANYQQKIQQIQEQIKILKSIELVLELFLITKEPIAIRTLSKFLHGLGFANEDGVFVYRENDNILFILASENGLKLDYNHEYTKFSLIAKLHQHPDPLKIMDSVFDFSESFMKSFESRLLSNNQQVMTQTEYNQLYNHVKKYREHVIKKQVQLGSSLIRRVL